MKPLTFVLLAATLLAHVALVVWSRRSAPPSAAVSPSFSSGGDMLPHPAKAAQPGQTTTIVAIKRSETPAGPTAAAPFVWPTTTQSDEDLQRVVAGLRAAGYPATVVRAVVNQLLNERFAPRSPHAGQPFWKRSGPPAPESVAAQTALSHERQTLFEALLGPDARPSALLDADARERRYGVLADDQIDAVARIERDYNEMSAEVWAKRRGNAPASMETMMLTQQLMEKEKLADLAAVLSPPELLQYEMRNSASARQLINHLRSVEVTAAEFTQLYQAQRAFDEANPQRPGMDASVYAQRQLAQLGLNERARAVLGETRFHAYLEGADRNYATVAQTMAKYPAVTPAISYRVYQLQLELQSQMSTTSRGGPLPPEKIAELRHTVTDYNARLETLVGAEVAEAYRNQGMGRIFNSLREAPRPAAGAPSATTPLVPFGK